MIKTLKGNFPSPMIKPCKGRNKGDKGSPSSVCSRSTADNSDDKSVDQTADYGVILVKKQKQEEPLPPSRIQNDHRGYGVRKKVKKKKELEKEMQEIENETFVGFLSAALCGACISSSGGEEKALADILAEDDDAAKPKPEEQPRLATNIYIQRFQKMKMQQQQIRIEEQKKEMSLLTDVSFLTDPSLTDIEVKEHILGYTMPIKPSVNTKPKMLPAFRKLHTRAANAIEKRKSQRDKKMRPSEQESILSPDPEASLMPPPPPPPMNQCSGCKHGNCSHHHQKPMVCTPVEARRASMRDRSKKTKKKERKSSLKIGKFGLKKWNQEKPDRRRLV